jgi:DNA uptake protein ComE-like DNA-binding protein
MNMAATHLRRGSILVAVLWCLVLLEVVVLGMLQSSRLGLRVAKNHSDALQAHYLALAGVERAKALLHAEMKDLRSRGLNDRSSLLSSPESFRDVPLGRGRMRIVRAGRAEEGGREVFGVEDEESRLDLNAAGAEELKRFPGMTDGIAAAILDWRDADDRVTPGGAEREEYQSLVPPRSPRNGPFESVEELLLVRGVSRELFLGQDRNGNGLLDPDEDAGNGLLEAGWSGLLTVESGVEDRDARGKLRVNLKTATEDELAGVAGISRDLAKAIIAYRGQKAFQSVLDLLDVARVEEARPAAVPQPAPTPEAVAAGGQPSGRSRGRALAGSAPAPSPAPPPAGAQPAQPGQAGEKLISETLFREIADSFTAGDRGEQPGAVNVNTAPEAVLRCLPGFNEELARAVADRRSSNGSFTSLAGLLDVPGMTREALKQAWPRLTLRSETFRIISEGLIPSTGARKRIVAIVRVRPGEAETRYFREEP